jgi:CheY-like chemotaxis protein
MTLCRVPSVTDNTKVEWRRRTARCCQNDTPALAILDIVMPRLGGLGTAAKLSERFSQIQVLFASGYSARTNDWPQTGSRRYLQEPYSRQTLRTTCVNLGSQPDRVVFGNGERGVEVGVPGQNAAPVRVARFLWSTVGGKSAGSPSPGPKLEDTERCARTKVELA